MSSSSHLHAGGVHGLDAGYDDAFYDEIAGPAGRSAEVVVPLVLGLADDGYPISSVVDVGCGLGTWLAAFIEHGVTDVIGIESDHIPADRLAIPPERLVIADLDNPPDLARHFDLAMSLEVAEHLELPAAPRFVDLLCRLAPVILFSAAIPGQGGVHHRNEQWPAWWAERFAAHGYQPCDWLRWLVWDDASVAYYYAQNMVVYVSADIADRLPPQRLGDGTAPPSLVHPTLLSLIANRPVRRADPSLQSLLRQLPRATARAARHRAARVASMARQGRAAPPTDNPSS
jgi:SAM-dependent methyltransferase